MRAVSRHVCNWRLVAAGFGLVRWFFSRCEECGAERHTGELLPSRCIVCKEDYAEAGSCYCARCLPICREALEAWRRYDAYLHSPHAGISPKGSRLYDAYHRTSKAERELWRQGIILLPDRQGEWVQEEIQV